MAPKHPGVKVKPPKARTFYYVATPYGKLDHNEAYRVSVLMGVMMLNKGYENFVPIVHSHPMAKEMPPQEHKFWMDRDRPMMKAASHLMVCMVPGWQLSEGIRQEIEYFKRARKPVFYYDPQTDTFHV